MLFIPQTGKKEITAGLQFTFGLFIYTLNTDSPGRVLLPACTAAQDSQTHAGTPSLSADLATRLPICQARGFAYYPIQGCSQPP